VVVVVMRVVVAALDGCCCSDAVWPVGGGYVVRGRERLSKWPGREEGGEEEIR
jgi:hypothetical protein